MGIKSSKTAFALLKETLSEFFDFPDELMGFEVFANAVNTLPYIKFYLYDDKGEQYSKVHGFNKNLLPSDGSRLVFEAMSRVVKMNSKMISFKLSCMQDDIVTIEAVCALEFK